MGQPRPCLKLPSLTIQNDQFFESFTNDITSNDIIVHAMMGVLSLTDIMTVMTRDHIMYDVVHGRLGKLRE